jgi:hypothetical protein
MSTLQDIHVPLDASTGPAMVDGVIEALYATRERSWGLSDGKTFHRYPPNSDLEAAHAKGCEFACARMIQEADRALEFQKLRNLP